MNEWSIFSRFIRTWMRRGELALFEQLFADTMYEVKKRQYIKWRKLKAAQAEGKQTDVSIDAIELNPIAILHAAVKNATPMLRLARVRRGGIMYQV